MVPCFLNLTLQPAVLSPQRSGASLLPYFAFLSPSFSCICTLFQVPYLVSPLLATLTKTAGVRTNNSRSGTLRCPLANPTPGYFDGATSFFLSAHSAFSVISALNPFLSLSFDFQLWTLNLASLRPIPFLFKLLRTLLHCEKSYPLSFHAILDSSHKTPGGGGGSITKTKREKDGALTTGSGQVPVVATGGQPRKRRIPALRGGEAGEKEAEEGVGIGIETDLSVGCIQRVGGIRDVRDIRPVGRACLSTGKTFVVNADAHRLNGAEAGIHKEGDGHWVEKGRCFLAPLVIEQSEDIGERVALAEQKGALDLVQLQLRGVQRHDKERHSRGKELLGRRNVIHDIPFGLRPEGRRIAKIAVAALDGAAHHDHALELAKRGRVFVDDAADVHQGSDGDQGDLARVTVDLFQDEGDSIGMRWLRIVPAFGVASLSERAFTHRGRARR